MTTVLPILSVEPIGDQGWYVSVGDSPGDARMVAILREEMRNRPAPAVGDRIRVVFHAPEFKGIVERARTKGVA